MNIPLIHNHSTSVPYIEITDPHLDFAFGMGILMIAENEKAIATHMRPSMVGNGSLELTARLCVAFVILKN